MKIQQIEVMHDLASSSKLRSQQQRKVKVSELQLKQHMAQCAQSEQEIDRAEYTAA
jgi:hypothetical protein